MLESAGEQEKAMQGLEYRLTFHDEFFANRDKVLLKQQKLVDGLADRDIEKVRSQ